MFFSRPRGWRNRTGGSPRRKVNGTYRPRPRLEPLADRLAPASFRVGHTLNAGAGSLRQAIADANAHVNVGGPDVIAFNLPATDAGHVYYRNDSVAGRVTLANVTATTAADDTAIADL